MRILLWQSVMSIIQSKCLMIPIHDWATYIGWFMNECFNFSCSMRGHSQSGTSHKRTSDSQRLRSSRCLEHKKGLDVTHCHFMLAAMHIGIRSQPLISIWADKDLVYQQKVGIQDVLVLHILGAATGMKKNSHHMSWVSCSIGISNNYHKFRNEYFMKVHLMFTMF